MIEGIPVEAVGVGAGWFIVVMGVIAVIRGDLVPRRTYDDLLHERDEWRAECRLKDQQIAEKDDQLRTLEEVGRTTEAVLLAIHSAAERRQ